MSRVRQVLQRVLAKAQRVLDVPEEHFYQQAIDCQIPTLWYLMEICFGRREHGLFVEVGANDGISVSNTIGLAKRGWRGYLIEPVPDMADLCRRNLKDFPQCSVHQTAISDGSAATITLYLGGLLSTANPELASEYKVISWAQKSMTGNCLEVPCVTLDRFLQYEGIEEEIDVLVVDVEGQEQNVFNGFSLESHRPKMIIVELADTHPDLTATTLNDHLLGKKISGSGYEIVFKDHINTVFVHTSLWSEVMWNLHKENSHEEH